ncbi:MAG TPA: TonB-dependent receptor [Steroidobacteraceae bacterium]|nr:TonB-dependent receptor [Steroidobacteraceae bacterium]
MANSRSLQQAVRLALATVTATAGVTTLHAQTAPAQPAEATAAPLQEVVVTGSRLKTPNETAISPITTVSAADVQATGLTRVEDILNNLPMVFAGENATTSNGADGTATIDLRGLGNQRTLVLVNGLRLGPGAGDGRNFSDINEIPAALIERVDILTGGASAVYGADAVAGVVNFILNTHFEGVKIDAGYHFYEHSNNNPDGVQQAVTQAGFVPAPGNVDTGFGKNVSVLAGSNFADNRGNATVYMTYDNQGATLQKSFDYSACSLTPNAAGTALACGGSSTSGKNGAGGRYLAFSNSGVELFDNTVDGLTGAFRPFTRPNDLFNYGPYNYYETPEQRWTAGGFLTYEINSHATFYANVMYMRNSQLAQIAPSGDFGNPSFIPCADPLLTAAETAVICSPANLAAQGNPYETFNGTNYPGLNLYILRRNVEGGPRVASFQADSIREVAGVKGDITDAFSYNVSAQRSSVDDAEQNLNYLSNSNIQQALNVLPSATGPVCGGPNNALGVGPLVTPGTAFSANSACIPWNIWNTNGVPAGGDPFLAIPEQLQANVTEYVVDGSITADFGKFGVKLPSADDGLQANVGTEWREDAAVFSPDYVSQQGLAAGGGGATPPVSGAFTVWEAFTELRLPLAQHQTAAEDLSLEGGYRYSNYSEGFTTNTYKIGLEWAPVTDVRLRGSYQRAVRAPNIGELYSPQSVGLDGSVDPCAAALANPANPTGPLTSGATLAGCEASGVTGPEYGKIIANPASQYNGLLGGNPNLQPEVSDTYTFGFVLTPRVVPNLSVSVDYFDIKLKSEITTIGGNVIINDCVFSGQFCNLVHRDPATGSLWLSPNGYVIDTTTNIGQLATKGFDVKASYRQTLPAGFGSLNFGLEGTKLNQLATTPVPGGGSYDCEGYFGDVCGGSDPSWRSVLNVTWSTPWDALDLTLRWRYFGSQTTEQLNPSPYLKGSSFYAPLAHIPAYNWIDLSATFNLYKNVRLELGVNNVFDKDPPIVTAADCSTSSPGGANCNGNTFPGVYDALGRYLFAHISAQF